MVECGGTCNGEIVAFVAVPLCKYPVQRKRLDCQYICLDGRFRPRRIDFTTCHVFDVIFIFDIVILGGAVGGRAVVDDDIFGNDNPAKYDFPGFIDWLNFILCDFGRIVAPERVVGDNE